MTAEDREPVSSLSIDHMRWIDQACDHFEAAWIEAFSSGQGAPSMLAYLQSAEPPLRKFLMPHLLRLDMEYRSRTGTQRSLDEYLGDFDEFSAVIHEFFTQVNKTDDAALQETRTRDGTSDCEESQPTPRLEECHRIGRFQILRELGRGSFGAVYRALDDELQREVAIKIAHRPSRTMEGDDRELAEARMAASLDHPAIVPILECGRRDDGSLYVVSKLIDGTDLKTRMKEFPLSVREAVTVVATIAEAAHYAHGKGLVHRDIKPANILIDAQQRPYLTDFGLALKSEFVGSGGEFVGTPSYMSPEQARLEGHLVDRRSDVFSLAVVLYELIYGRLPFAGETRPALLEAIQQAKPPEFGPEQPGVTTDLELLLRKALSRRATDRHETAQALADDLLAWSRREVLSRVAVGEEWTPVLPRGLRSFTANDAPFFSRLVPGPRNRDGIPEAIAFWKTRIEGNTPEETFRVGVLYGHSGTGKSSLVKAGVIPHLDRSVITVWTSATADRTEQTWLRALRHQFPSIRPDDNLSAAIRHLRDGRMPSDQKLLIVVDQFEQWLSAHGDFDAAPLVAALRQCDGVRVQVLLVVRDDYWADLTRCLAAAEAQLDSSNSRATELFDAAHARHVLQEFGTGLGRFQVQDLENQKFVEDAVAQITAHGAAVPVQLALFADVMQARPWTVAELRRVRGVEGATTLLLDQVVSSDAAHPTLHRYARETGYLLRALLPVTGSSIKASPKSVPELREASGLDESAVGEVLGVLDREFRLVSTVAESESEGLRYQLSHDYLIPIVRQWSQRTHGDTLVGRLELSLDDCTKTWNANRRARHLPSFLEWIGIALLTRGARRTRASQRMLHAATRYYAAATMACGILLTLTAVLLQVQIRKMHWANLVEQLSVAETPQVEELIARIQTRPRNAADAIARFRAASPQAASNDWALELALFAVGHGNASFVVERALDADPAQLEIICRQLANRPNDLPDAALERARRTANGALPAADEHTPSEPGKYLAAAALLAQLTPEAVDWRQWSRPTVSAIGPIPSDQVPTWIDLLRPVGRHLQEPVLAALARGPQSPDLARRAAEMVAAYYAGQPELLIAALERAHPEEFGQLLPTLDRHAGITRHLQSRLDDLERPPPPVDVTVDHYPAVKALLKATTGFSTPDFALTLIASRHELIQLDELLGKEGYRLRRCRPTSTDGSSFSALWQKRPGTTTAAWDVTRDELLRMDERLGAHWQPIDVASYSLPGEDSPRFCAFWSQQSTHGGSRDHDDRIRVFDWQLPFQYTAAGTTAPRCLKTLQAQRHLDGRVIYSVIDRRSPENFQQDRWTARTNLDLHAMDDVIDDVSFVTDIAFSDELGYQGALRAWEWQLAESQGHQDDSSAASLSETLNYRQALAHYQLGRFEEAYQLLLPEIGPGRVPQRWTLSLIARTAARLQKADALELMQRYLREESRLYDRVHVESFVRECTGSDGMAMIREAIQSHSENDLLVATSAIACAEAVDHWRGVHEPRCQEWAQLMGELLRLAYQRDVHEWPLEDYPCFVREVEQHAAMRKLVPRKRFHAIHHNAVGIEQRWTRGTPPEILTGAGKLARQGFEPHAIASLREEERTEFLVLWFRPHPRTADRVDLSNRKARLISALLAMGMPESVGTQLTMHTDPSVPFDIARVACEQRIPQQVWWNLAAHDAADVRFFSLLALRNYPLQLETTQLSELESWYRTDPDVGVHSAIRAIFDSINQFALRRDLDRQLSTANEDADKRWFVNSIGMTFAKVHGPVTFKMGSPSNEPWRWPQNEILHRCRIGHSFAVATTETTCQQFGLYRQDPQAGGPDRPQNTTWFDAVRFCRWLSEKEGVPEEEMCYPPLDEIGPGMMVKHGYLTRTGYRLPTEAEWEFACRAGSASAWYCGDDRNVLAAFAVAERRDSMPQRVAQRLPNRLGLFDMSGNLAEWCQDSHQIYDFTLGKRARWETGWSGRVNQADRRVVRGGHYLSPRKHTRSASRAAESVSAPSNYVGFRIVRTLNNGISESSQVQAEVADAGPMR